MKKNKIIKQYFVSSDISVSLEKGERAVRQTHVVSRHLCNSISAHWDQNEHRQCQLAYKVTKTKKGIKKIKPSRKQRQEAGIIQRKTAWIAEAVRGVLVSRGCGCSCCPTFRQVLLSLHWEECVCCWERERMLTCVSLQKVVYPCYLLSRRCLSHANTTHLSLRSSFSSPSRLRAAGRTCASLPVTRQRAILSGTGRQTQPELIHTPAVAALRALRGEALWETRAKRRRLLQAGEKKRCWRTCRIL